MKILLISLAGIGDTLMATPLIHELRASFPQARIDALVMWAGSRDLLQSNPHLSSVIHQNLIKAMPHETWTCLQDLRRQRYNVSINTYPQSRTVYRAVARFIAAEARFSHVYDRWSVLDHALMTRTMEQDYTLHAVENNLNLLKLLGASPKLPQHSYELALSAEERKWAQHFLGDDRRKILGIHVGSGPTKNLPLRRWPIENWTGLVQRILHEQPAWRVFLFGGPEEAEAHATILGDVTDSRVIAPQTRNFRHAAAVLEKCHAFISVDTSLMHLAAAMKVPHQFVIETPTFNETVEPYGQRFTVIPNPMVAGRNLDFYRYDGKGIKASAEEIGAMMRSVTVEAVFQSMRKVLES